MSQLLGDKFHKSLVDQIKKCSRSITIISPYVTQPAVQELIDSLPAKVKKRSLITLPPGADYVNGSVDVAALELLHRHGFEIRWLADLHAKIYWLDETTAFVGSANFTTSGWKLNHDGNIEDMLLIQTSKADHSHIHSRYIAPSKVLDLNGQWTIDVEKAKAAFLKQYEKLMKSVVINFPVNERSVSMFSSYRHPPNSCKYYFQFNLAKTTGKDIKKDKQDIVLELGGEKGSPHATINIPFAKFGKYLTAKYMSASGENWQFQLGIEHNDNIILRIKGMEVKFHMKELQGVLVGA